MPGLEEQDPAYGRVGRVLQCGPATQLRIAAIPVGLRVEILVAQGSYVGHDGLSDTSDTTGCLSLSSTWSLRLKRSGRRMARQTRRYFTNRQSPVLATARAKHRTARDSASRCATAESASVSSASAGQETADAGAAGRDALEKYRAPPTFTHIGRSANV